VVRDADDLVRLLASRTVDLVEREYPNSIRLTLQRPPTEPVTPRSIYPAFHGCYDWHSAVHSHWQIVRALQRLSEPEFDSAARAVLDRTLTHENIATEMEWIAQRPGFEMPYGLAWLLRLCAELRAWGDLQGDGWLTALVPLEAHAIERFQRYCSQMTMPIRGGMHNQSAFSLGLVWDSVDDPEVRSLITDAARRWFGGDTDIDLRFEPSAADFLSPALSEADLMRRVMPADEFAAWLERFAPQGFDALAPVAVVDPSDGQLAHWAGLNLSRSWMTTSIADALPNDHRLTDGLRSTAAAHADAGVPMATHDDYMISHWVPTFAVYGVGLANGQFASVSGAERS
jgi:hypothetical protein